VHLTRPSLDPDAGSGSARRQYLRRALAPGWRRVVGRAGPAYIAGPELADGLRVCRRLWEQGIATTIGYWQAPGEPLSRVADAYLAAVDALAGESADSRLAVKAPALGFSEDLLADILERSAQAGLGVDFDSLEPAAADRTFELIRDGLPRNPALGCTLPGRWRRSVRDADRAIALDLRVRVVKGQWADRAEPEMGFRRGFLAVVDRLAARARHVGVATRDSTLAREALRRLRALGTPAELELVLGLPSRAALEVAREAGVPVRVYVPYGIAALPYSLSQARGHPRVLWWLLQALVRAGGGRAQR